MAKGSGRDRNISALLVKKLLFAEYINKFEVLLRCRGSIRRPRALINLEWESEWGPNARNMFVPARK